MSHKFVLREGDRFEFGGDNLVWEVIVVGKENVILAVVEANDTFLRGYETTLRRRDP